MDYSDIVKQEWKPSMGGDPISIDIEDRMHIAAEIDTRPADIESLETYEDRIGDYKARGFTYIPLPGDGKYYNTDEGWLRDLRFEQIIDEDTHLMEVLRLLQEQPFLLVDAKSFLSILVYVDERTPKLLYPDVHQEKSYASMNGSMAFEMVDEDETEKIESMTMTEAKNEYPSLSQVIDTAADDYLEYDDDRYGIITLADVNRRGVKIMLYVVFSGLVSRLARNIEQEHPSSESIFKHLRAETIGRWHKNRMEGLEIHVAEQMNMIEIMQVIQASDKEFVKKCGFTSKSAVEKMNSINDIRNRVMHANKSLIYDRRDIKMVLNAIQSSQEIVSNMD